MNYCYLLIIFIIPFCSVNAFAISGKVLWDYIKRVDQLREQITKCEGEEKKESDQHCSALVKQPALFEYTREELHQKLDRLTHEVKELDRNGDVVSPIILAIPKPVEHDKHFFQRKTQNGYGVEMHAETPIVQEFLYASESSLYRGKMYAADIGCGYGVNILPLLRSNEEERVTAIDRDPANLRVLVTEAAAADAHLDKLEVHLGTFPHDSPLQDESLDTMLFSHVFHYMTPEEIRKSIAIARKALVPGGKIFIQSLNINADPYKNIKEEGLKRAKNSEDPWPFFFSDIKKKGMPAIGHPQDLKVLRRELESAGFKIVKEGTFSLLSHGWQNIPSDNTIGIIAEKKVTFDESLDFTKRDLLRNRR